MFRTIPRHNINLSKEEIALIVSKILDGSAPSGNDLAAFEDEMAVYQGLPFVAAVNSGRAALYLILKAMNFSLGSEILVPAYSFYSVVESVKAAGLSPVFAPCHPRHYALDPSRLDSALTKNTVALIVEHPFGQTAPMDDIMDWSQGHGLPVIEDASQSIGASLNGKKAGSFGLASCMSLVHGKNLMTFGGGLVLTKEEKIYREVLQQIVKTRPIEAGKIRKEALSGLVNWALTTRIGYQFGPFAPFFLLNLFDRKRLEAFFEEAHSLYDPKALKPLSNLQAGLGREQLKRLDERNSKRRTLAEQIIHGLSDTNALSLPEYPPNSIGTWNALAVRVPSSLTVQRECLRYGVDTRADYMTGFAYQDEWLRHGEVLYLPCHPGMSFADADYVVETVKKVMRKLAY